MNQVTRVSTDNPVRRPRLLGAVLALVTAGALLLAVSGCGQTAGTAVPDPVRAATPTANDVSVAEQAGNANWVDPTNGLQGWALNQSERGTPSRGAHLEPRWQIDHVGPVYGAPLLVEDTVYLQTPVGSWALDPESGAVDWTNDQVNGFAGFSFHDGALYSVNRDATRVVRVDPGSGEVEWSTELPAQLYAATYAPPRVFDGVVLVGESSTETFAAQDEFAFRGRMYGLDEESGEIIWERFTTEPPHTGASVWTFTSIDESTGTAYFGTSNNYAEPASESSDAVFAIDVATGRTKWSRQLLADDVWAFATHGANGGFDYDVSTSPVLVDAGDAGSSAPLVVVAQKSGIVTALDRDSGDLRWTHQASDGGRQGGVLGNMSFDGTRLLVVGNNGSLDSPDAEPWNREEVVPRDFWPPDAEPTAILQALDPATGSEIWARQIAAWSLGSVSVVDGLGFLPVGEGIEMFDPETGRKLDRVQLPKEASATVSGAGSTVLAGVSGGWGGDGDTLIAFDIVED